MNEIRVELWFVFVSHSALYVVGVPYMIIDGMDICLLL